MIASSRWLLPLVDVDGDEDHLLPKLHEIFCADFKVQRPMLYGLQVHWDTKPSSGRPYEAGFIHLVTEDGPPLMRRAFEPARAARICWCAPTILNCDCSTVTAWDYKESKGVIRRYLWLQRERYLVILEKQSRKWGEVYFLVTAYHADGASTQAKLQRKYSDRVG